MLRVFYSCLFLMASATALAQERVPIEVSHSGEDSVGQAVVYEIKEFIRRSSALRIANDNSQARLVLNMVTLEGDRSNRGVYSAIATTIVYDATYVPIGGAYITTYVQTCGQSKTQECAKAIVVAVDREADKLRREWPGLWKDMFKK